MVHSELKGCPFCGGKAGFEEVNLGEYISYTVGCHNENVDCIGTMMITTYDTKRNAAAAWNKRAPILIEEPPF